MTMKDFGKEFISHEWLIKRIKSNETTESRISDLYDALQYYQKYNEYPFNPDEIVQICSTKFQSILNGYVDWIMFQDGIEDEVFSHLHRIM